MRSYHSDDADCPHDYGWPCDDCPVVTEPWAAEEERQEKIKRSPLFRFIMFHEPPKADSPKVKNEFF